MTLEYRRRGRWSRPTSPGESFQVQRDQRSRTGGLGLRIDLFTVVAAGFLLFIVLKLATDSQVGTETGFNFANTREASENTGSVEGQSAVPRPSTVAGLTEPVGDQASLATSEQVYYPYERFTITQGPHGSAYGHMAIDLTAGRDAEIRSPITGKVTAVYQDPYGNPALLLENDRYIVTMLHGRYTVAAGDLVEVGQPVGFESNIGYTTDWQGRLCRNRDCGYHTHLNVYDKVLGENVNPMELLVALPRWGETAP